jgi:hypothetical protein
MKTLQTLATAVLFTLCTIEISSAENSVFTDIQNDVKGIPSDMSASNYIFAAGVTLGIANYELKLKSQKLIYCQPYELSLSLKDYQKITLKAYNRNKIKFDKLETDNPLVAMSMALTKGMENEFPCY